MKEFENIVLEPTKQDFTTLGGKKIQTTGLLKDLILIHLSKILQIQIIHYFLATMLFQTLDQ